MENWSDVKGYEGFYQVSDYGRVRSVPRVIEHPNGPTRRRGKVLKQYNGSKYKHKNVKLCGKTLKVHHLVLEAFVETRPKDTVCRHLDGNPENNHYLNLRWGTYKENAQDMINHGNGGRCKGENNGNSKYKKENVLEIIFMHKNGMTEKDIYSSTKYPKHFVHDVVSGRVWSELTGRQLIKKGLKITEQQKKEIKQLAEKGSLSHEKIGKMYDISRAYVGKILKKVVEN